MNRWWWWTVKWHTERGRERGRGERKRNNHDKCDCKLCTLLVGDVSDGGQQTANKGKLTEWQMCLWQHELAFVWRKNEKRKMGEKWRNVWCFQWATCRLVDFRCRSKNEEHVNNNNNRVCTEVLVAKITVYWQLETDKHLQLART